MSEAVHTLRAPHSRMGKKGLGRKAFVKAAMAQPSGRGEEQEAEDFSTPAQAAEAVVSSAEVEQPEQSMDAPQQACSAADVPAAPPSPDIPGDETRGQILQRHKRVPGVLESAGTDSLAFQHAAHLTAGRLTRSSRRTRS